MATTAGELSAILSAKIDGFTAEFRQAEESVRNFSQVAQARIEEAGKAIDQYKAQITAVAAVSTAAIGGSLVAFNSLDQALSEIRRLTGANSEAMEGFREVLNNVATQVPESLGDVATAIGEVNTRLGFTGEALERSSKSFLEFARVNDTDVAGSIRTVSRLISSFNLEAEDSGFLLDQLTLIGQRTGADVLQLGDNILRSRVTLEQFGFSLSEQIALFGQFEQAGIETSQAVSSFQAALARLASQGVEPSKEVFGELMREIQEAPTSMDAINVASDIFGRTVGGTLAQAIREGRFEIDEMVEALEGSSGVLSETADESRTLAEELGQFRNEITIAVSDVGEKFVPIIRIAREQLGSLVAMFRELPDPVKVGLAGILGLTAAVSSGALAFSAMIKLLGPLMTLIGKAPPLILAKAGAMGLLAGKVLLVVGALVVIQRALDAFSSGAVEASKETGELSRGMTLLALASETLKNILTLNFSEMFKVVEVIGAGFKIILQNMGLATVAFAREWINRMLTVARAGDGLLSLFGISGSVSRGVVAGLEKASAELTRFGQEIVKDQDATREQARQTARSIIESSTRQTSALGDVSEEFKRLTEEAKKAAEEAGKLKNEAEGTEEGLEGIASGAESATDSLNEARTAVESLSGSLDSMNALVTETSRRIRGEFSGIAGELDRISGDVSRSLGDAARIRAEAEEALRTAILTGDDEIVAQARETSDRINQEFARLSELVPEEIRARTERAISAIIEAEAKGTNDILGRIEAREAERLALEAELDGRSEEARRQRQETAFQRDIARIEQQSRERIDARRKEIDELDRLIEDSRRREADLVTERSTEGADTEVIDAELEAVRSLLASTLELRETQSARVVEVERQTQDLITSIRQEQITRREQLEANIRAEGVNKAVQERINSIEREKNAEILALREASAEREQTSEERARIAEEQSRIEAVAAQRRVEIVREALESVGENERGMTDLRVSLLNTLESETQRAEESRVRTVENSSARITAEIRSEIEERRELLRESLNIEDERREGFERASRLRQAVISSETGKAAESLRNLSEIASIEQARLGIITQERIELEAIALTETGRRREEIEREITRLKQEEEQIRLETTRANAEIEIEIEQQRANQVAEILRGQFFVIEDESVSFRLSLSNIWDNFVQIQQQAFVESANESIRNLFLVRDSSKQAAEESSEAWRKANAEKVSSSGEAAQGIGGIFESLIGSLGGIFGGGGGIPGIAGGLFGGGGLSSLLGLIPGGNILGMGIGLLGGLFGKKGGQEPASQGVMSVVNQTPAVGTLQRAAESLERAVSRPTVSSIGAAGRSQIVQSISVPVQITVNAEGLDEVAERVREGVPDAVRTAVDDLKRLDAIAERGIPRRSAA